MHAGDAGPAGGRKLAVVKAGEQHILRDMQVVLPQGDNCTCRNGVGGAHNAVKGHLPGKKLRNGGARVFYGYLRQVDRDVLLLVQAVFRQSALKARVTGQLVCVVAQAF